MRRPLAPLGLSLLSLTALAALLAGGAWGGYAFAAVAALFPAPLIALGATRRGRLAAGVAWTVAALAATLLAAFATLFALRGAAHEAGSWPASLVVLLAGVWLLPLAFVGLAYAFTFDRHGLDAADLERLRRLRDGGREVDGRQR